jgi:hypothetical protein
LQAHIINKHINPKIKQCQQTKQNNCNPTSSNGICVLKIIHQEKGNLTQSEKSYGCQCAFK